MVNKIIKDKQLDYICEIKYDKVYAKPTKSKTFVENFL